MRRRSLLMFCFAFFVAAAVFSAEWRHAEVDGIDVAYRDSGPGGARRALLFIHGWGCDSSFWEAQLNAFSGRYRVIALDLPGFGRSGKPTGAAYTPELFARAVKAVADDSGAEEIVLVGHSMGVAAARRYFADYPDAARALVNVDGAVMFFPEDPSARAAMAEGLAGFARMFAEGPGQKAAVDGFIEATFLGKTPESVREVVRAAMGSIAPHVCAGSMSEFVKPEWWTPASFSQPCLALYSDNPQEDPEIEDKLRGEFPNLTFAVWPDTGHFLMMEQPERFNAEVQEFLDSIGFHGAADK